MQPRSGLDGVRIARVSVRRATRSCGGADMQGLERVLHLLEAAAGAMRQAEAGIRSGLLDEAFELRRQASLLKREIACMMRAVDGCAALCRGLSLRLGCAAPAYTPQGLPAAAAPGSGECELLG